MPKGGIIPRRGARGPDRAAEVQPELKLPFAMHGAEPLFRWLMDTAADTKEIESCIYSTLLDLKDLATATNDQLANIAELLENLKSARSDADRGESTPQRETVSSSDDVAHPSAETRADKPKLEYGPDGLPTSIERTD